MSVSVSVLITVYNREQYVGETLRSVLASEWSDFEVIVVDDCSTDRSVDVIEEIAKSDDRVKFHRNESNLGDYGNRMHAAELAKGTFLKYVDSDDRIYRHTLGVMTEAMLGYPDAAVGLAHSVADDCQPYPWRLEPEQAYQKHYLQSGCLSCGPLGAIIRRDCFMEHGGFDKTWGVLSDVEFWLRIAAKQPIVLLPPGLVWWRRHEDQEYTKDDAGDVYLNRGYEMDCRALGSDDCPLSAVDRQRALSRINHWHARRLLSLAVRRRQPLKSFRMMRDSGLSPTAMLRGLRPYQ